MLISECFCLTNARVHDEYPVVVRVWIGWKHEKAGLLRVVSFGRSADRLAIGKGDLKFPAVSPLFQLLGVLPLSITAEVLDEENGLQIEELHVLSSILLCVWLGEQSKTVTKRRKIKNKALESLAIDASYYHSTCATR
jgi:hypothetical protein